MKTFRKKFFFFPLFYKFLFCLFFGCVVFVVQVYIVGIIVKIQNNRQKTVRFVFHSSPFKNAEQPQQHFLSHPSPVRHNRKCAFV